MNIQQLQYIVSVDEHRHFQRAADSCFITPATLSMMIKKLEQELDITIFDRKKQPIAPTTIGEVVIEKAKTILYHIKDLEDSVKSQNEEIAGEFRLAIIPTLAPYLMHLFLPNLLNKYPNLRIKLYEWNTEQIIEALNHDRLDIAIAATPLKKIEIIEHPIFYEKLVAFTAEKTLTHKNYIAPNDINFNRLWFLEEDHCLRSQVVNLCSLKRKYGIKLHLDFEAASIETLMNIVEMKEGITVLPELVIHTLSEERKLKVKQFVEPIPVREISLLTYRHFNKSGLIRAIINEIQTAVSPFIDHDSKERKLISI